MGRRVGVVGAGSWGTALAALLTRGGHDVVIWAHEEEVASEIMSDHRNSAFLPGVELPAALEATSQIEEAVSDAEVVLSVSPSAFVREVAGRAAPHVRDDAVLVSATKGIELGSLKCMDEVLEEALGAGVRERLAVLSGPSFAREVAEGAPTAVVAASASASVAEEVQALFQVGYFRVYTNADVVGAQIGGALKNVIALAAGTAAGLGFGHNTMAALITRGLAEIARLGVALGASPSTFAGLAGLGDLVLTCTGDLSRNRRVGYRLGRGEHLDAVLGGMSGVAEGVRTARAARELAGRHDVEMPISEEVYQMLAEGRSPREALKSLMARDPKPEEWS